MILPTTRALFLAMLAYITIKTAGGLTHQLSSPFNACNPFDENTDCFHPVCSISAMSASPLSRTKNFRTTSTVIRAEFFKCS